MNNKQIDKIEVKYQSKFELYMDKVKIFILSIIKQGNCSTHSLTRRTIIFNFLF